MISKVFREECKAKGYTFTAGKFSTDKCADLTIREISSGDKVKLSILHAFGEMDAACWTDMTNHSLEFKSIVSETIEHIALTRGVKVVLNSFHTILEENEVVKWCELEGFKEFASLFRDGTLHEQASVKVYDSKALFERINVNKAVEDALDVTPLFGRYKTTNWLAEMRVWWWDEERGHGELSIYSQDGFHLKVNNDRQLIKVNTLDDLRTLIYDVANKRGEFANLA